MKKALYLVLFYIFMSVFNFASALENYDINQMVNSTTMPTDAEIMQVIDKYNFDAAQKDLIFRETKRQLEELYSAKNPSVSPSASSSAESGNNQESQSTKKYSSHPPLHTKQKYGPQRNR